MSSRLVSVSAVNKISSLIFRRGYAAAASPAQGVAKNNATVVMMKKGAIEEPAKNSSWIPDPKTGYYRPGNSEKQIDAADLREIFLNNNKISRPN